MGVSLLNSLSLIHDAGYIYNDLKLDNLVVGDAPELSGSSHNLHKIRLIDYGMAKKYVDASGIHMED